MKFSQIEAETVIIGHHFRLPNTALPKTLDRLSILITLPLSYTVKMDNYPKQLNKYIYYNLLNGII